MITSFQIYQSGGFTPYRDDESVEHMQRSNGEREQSQLFPAQHPAIQPVRETPETNILWLVSYIILHMLDNVHLCTGMHHLVFYVWLVFGSSVELKEGSYDTRQVAQSQHDERHNGKHLRDEG